MIFFNWRNDNYCCSSAVECCLPHWVTVQPICAVTSFQNQIFKCFILEVWKFNSDFFSAVTIVRQIWQIHLTPYTYPQPVLFWTLLISCLLSCRFTSQILYIPTKVMNILSPSVLACAQSPKTDRSTSRFSAGDNILVAFEMPNGDIIW